MGNTVGGKQSRKGALFAYWLGLTLPVLINEEQGFSYGHIHPLEYRLAGHRVLNEDGLLKRHNNV